MEINSFLKAVKSIVSPETRMTYKVKAEMSMNYGVT